MAFDNSKGSVMLEFMRAADVDKPALPPAEREYSPKRLRDAYNNVPSYAEVKKQFGLADHEIKDSLPIPLQRDNGFSYVIVISTDAAERLEKTKPAGFVQNWSNPGIGPA